MQKIHSFATNNKMQKQIDLGSGNFSEKGQSS